MNLQNIAPHLNWTHFDIPLSKWGAIDVARRQVSPTSSKIVLLDADDPFQEDSIHHVWKKVEVDDLDLIIGEREQITLRAEDEFSPHSRLYVEIFSNALLLVLLGKKYSKSIFPPDIQSGFYVIRRDLLTELRIDYVIAYGGELALYYQLAKRHCRIERIPMKTRPSVVSSYNLRQIIKDIFLLPFISNATPNEVESAKNIAPLMYKRFLEQGEELLYFGEIESIIALRNTL